MTTSCETAPLFPAYAAVAGSTGTGLDAWISVIVHDPGLNHRIDTAEIAEGASCADALNAMIIEGIQATGVANDGTLTASDLYDVNAWVRASEARYKTFVDLHGDDEGDREWGFHLVQNDGGSSRLYANAAVNTVFDGTYHFGFEIENGRFLNEDGNKNASVESVAHWLSVALADDLASGGLANTAVDPYAGIPETGTGLDVLTETIIADEGLNRKIATAEIAEGARCAGELNTMLLEGIHATGAANDGVFTTADLHAINAWVRSDKDRLKTFVDLHGDDEDGQEWGFHLVQNDGDTTYLFDRPAVDRVADGLYHFGFEIERDRFLNEDGNRNVSLETAAGWLNVLLADDLAGGALVNPDLLSSAVDPAALAAAQVIAPLDLTFGGTGLGTDLGAGPDLALAEGTITLSVAADDLSGWKGLFSRDARDQEDPGHVTAWMCDSGFKVRFQTETDSTYLQARGLTVETGVVHDVAVTFGSNGGALYVNGVLADAETGFLVNWTENPETLIVGANAYARTDSNPDWRAQRLDGTIEDFTVYDRVLTDGEIASLCLGSVAPVIDVPDAPDDPLFPDYAAIAGTTGTGLDAWIDVIVRDPGLNHRIDTSEIAEGASCADALNAMIIEGIQATGVANDGTLTASDLYDVNAWVRASEARYKTFVDLHGDDEGDREWGFHLVQNDGGTSRLFANAAVNRVFDGTYHIGFEIENGRFLNEDGNRNASLESVAHWLSVALADDLADGTTLVGQTDPYAAVVATKTGLDVLTETIIADEGLNRKIATAEIAEGARCASLLNQMLVDGIKVTGVANDGVLSTLDLRAVNAWVRSDAERLKTFVALHGDDENSQEWGFHLVQNDGDTTYLFDRPAVDTVADGIYHFGFEIERDRFLNEDGNRNVSLKTAAGWLNVLLDDELASGALANADLIPDTGDLDALYGAAVLSRGTDTFDGTTASHLDIPHSAALALASGTVSLAFTADATDGYRTLFSKDHTGYEDGGHLTARLVKGRLDVRFQSDTESLYLKANTLTIQPGERHTMAFSFGPEGAKLYVDGQLADTAADFTSDLTLNDNSLVLGAGATRRSDDKPDRIDDPFDGTIEDFAVFSGALGEDEIAWLANAPADYTPPNTAPVAVDDGPVRVVAGQTATVALADLLANDSDANADALTITAVDAIGGGTVALSGDSVVYSADAAVPAGGAGFTYTVDDGRGGSDTATVTVDVLDPADAPVPVFMLSPQTLAVDSTADIVDVPHDPALALAEGTFALSFVSDNGSGGDRDTLFSKDARGYADGGHITCYVQRGDLILRLQDTERSVTLKADNAVTDGIEHDMLLAFGTDGARLYLDGALADQTDFAYSLETNAESLVVGANAWGRTSGTSDKIYDSFHGTIADVMVFAEALTPDDLFA